MIQPLFYKEGDDNYETIFPFKYTLNLIAVCFLANWLMLGLSAFLSTFRESADPIKTELNSAQEANKEARTISTNVAEGLQGVATNLREVREELDESVQQLNTNAAEASEIGVGLQHIYSGAKETERDLASAGALIEESLQLLQEVENKGKNI